MKDQSIQDFINSDSVWQHEKASDPISKKYLPFLEHMFSNIEAASIKEISLNEYNVNSFTGEHGYLSQGYFRIIHELAKPLSSKEINLNCKVLKIDYSGTGGKKASRKLNIYRLSDPDSNEPRIHKCL